MRILLLTPHLPEPAQQGTALRNGAFLRYLGARHSVDLLTFLAPGEALAADNALHTWCRRVLALPQPLRSTAARLRDTLLSPLPDMALRLESAAMHALVAQWTAETAYDIIQVEGIEMAPYGLALQGKVAARIVFDNHNCEYLLQKRNALTDAHHVTRWPAAAYSLVQWAKLRAYEARACLAADAVVAVSEADAAALRALAPGIAPTVVTNGIDLEEYAPVRQNGNSSAPPSATLVFTGKMDYRPNIDAVLWFAREVLPLVLARRPDVLLRVVGRNPHERLDVLGEHPAIQITGVVEDIRPWLWNAGVAVIPLRVGGGTRFKALEAMACGVPVVSTHLGVEGINVEQGHEMFLADEPSAMADAICTILAPGNDALRHHLATNGRTFVERTYGWPPIVERLTALHSALLTPYTTRRVVAPTH